MAAFPPAYVTLKDAQVTGTPSLSARSLCFTAGVALVGGVILAAALTSAPTATQQFTASGTAVRVTAPTVLSRIPRRRFDAAQPAVVVQAAASKANAANAAASATAAEESTSVPSSALPFVAVCGSILAAAVFQWRKNAERTLVLQPTYMACGEPGEVAMFYTTGYRSEGRASTRVYNLIDRMGRLVRSNVTWVVQQLEDPEKVIEQAVTDMQADLVKIRQSYSEVLATQKRTEVKQRQAMELVAQWQKRAELALTKGDEELAREALRRKNVEQKALDGLNAQLAQAEPVAQNLLNSMKLLEQKLDEAKANKAQLIARAKSAQTTKKVNDMLTGLDTGSAMAAFERMEEKVQSLEANAEVAGMLAEGTTLDKRFASLEGSSAVDDELAAMKRQLEGPKSAPQAYLPPSADEDAEIARIRQQLRNN